MRKPCLVAVFLLLATGLIAPVSADELILTYGDRISGRIVSLTATTIQIDTPGTGLITIDRRYVEQLSTNDVRAVELASGERVIGRIVADSGRTVTIDSVLLGQQRIPLDGIVAIFDVEGSAQTAGSSERVRGKGGSSGTALGRQQPNPPNTQQPKPIGQEPEDDDIRLIFLRQSTVLLGPGQLELETGFNYLHGQSVSPILNARFREFLMPLAFRIGLFDRAEGFVTLSGAYLRQDLGFADDVVSRSDGGIGDVSAGFNYEVASETAGRPAVIATAAAGMPTGSEPNEAGISLGTGHWAASAGVQFIKIVDPVALFGGIRYEHQFAARYFLIDGVRDVEPGRAIGYNFGFGFAMNEQISLSAQVVSTYQSGIRADGVGVFASSREPVSLRSAVTYQYARGTYIEPSIAIGLDEDTPDFTLGFSVTHRFGP